MNFRYSNKNKLNKIINKNNISVVILFSLCLTLLAITGCSSSSSTYSPQASFNKGTQGVVFSFLNAQEWETIYTGEGQEAAEIVVEIQNKGSSKVRQIETSFGGFDTGTLSIAPIDIDVQELEPATRFNPKGGYTIASTRIIAQSLGKIETYDAPLTMYYCYPYETRASVELCVDPTPHKNNKLDGCTPETFSATGQGAPVSISNIEFESMQNALRLKIELQNNGNDEIYTNNGALNCETALPLGTRQGVYLEEPPVLGVSNVGECFVDEFIRFEDNKATIMCVFNVDSSTQEAYNTILNINLGYYVRGNIQKNIKIINQKNEYNW